MTLDWAALISCRAARASSLLASWATPSTELTTTTNMMMITSAQSASPLIMPVAALMMAATMSMMTMGSAICWKKRIHSGVFSSSFSLLGPCLARRSDAAASERPDSPSVPCAESTSSADDRYSFTFTPPGIESPGRSVPDHNSPGGARAHQGCHAGHLYDRVHFTL